MKKYLIILTKKVSVMYKKFLCMLFIGALSLITPTSATEEAAEPLHTGSGASPHVALHPAPPTCWERGLASLPEWYNPCLGPVVTNIKYFDLDPYWVNSRSPVFQEVYGELEPLTPGICRQGKILRNLRKLCIVSRTVEGVEQRYDPFSNWCDNVGCIACCTLVPAGLGMLLSAPTIVVAKAGLLLTIIGGSWCCLGTCSTAMKCCLAKIHYGPPSGGCLDYLRSTPE
jgi:hypothetical protein